VSRNGVLTERHTDHDNGPPLDSSITSISYEDRRPSLGEGAVGRAEDRRRPPHGGVLAVDRNIANYSNNSDNEDHTSSSSTSRRSRIFYVDQEGFSHIRSRRNGNNNNRTTINGSSNNRNINQNRFSVLSDNNVQVNEVSEDRAYASLMREVLNGMDSETRQRLEERARRVANVVPDVNTSSVTQSRSTTVVPTHTPTVTLPSDTIRSPPYEPRKFYLNISRRSRKFSEAEMSNRKGVRLIGNRTSYRGTSTMETDYLEDQT